MSEVLDDQYLDWIYDQIGLQQENVYHYHLIRQLHTIEFIMLVPNDDNRIKDGLILRKEFVNSRGRMIEVEQHWYEMGCSVLEMLLGVSRHLSFQENGPVGDWFWHLMDNLGLSRYHDGRWNGRRIQTIVEDLVWRRYNADGSGGLFPLKHPREDQTLVEIWYQMEAYTLELS